MNRNSAPSIVYLRDLIAWNRRNGFRPMHDHERRELAEIYRQIAGRHGNRAFVRHLPKLVRVLHSIIAL